jgi:hypothetical protein
MAAMLTKPTGAATAVHRGASTCRWAVPTLLAPAPCWFEAERAAWTCLRDDTPRLLDNTDECADCPRWEPGRSS